MKLIIINEIINSKILFKKENKLYWQNKDYIYLLLNNNISDVLHILTKILYKNNFTKVIYLGFGTSISKEISLNDTILVEKAHNLLVDLTVFGYPIGKFPKEDYIKTPILKTKETYLKNIPSLKKAIVGSASFGENNKNYLKYIENKFFNKIQVIDNITAPIFFILKKFNIDDISSFLIINKNIYDSIKIENKNIINLYKKILKFI